MKHLLVVLFVLSGAVHIQAQDEPVLVTDLLKIAQPGSITFSPDGSMFVFTVRTIVEDRYVTQLWLVESTGSKPRQLTFAKEGATAPFWHPSGKSIGFLRTLDGNTQAYHLPLNGGEAAKLTNHTKSISNVRFSPDGNSILFSSSLTLTELLADSAFAAGPSWPLEIPGRAVTDVPAGTKANPDGSIAEIRAYLNANTKEGNPRVVTRLNFQGETNLNPMLSFTHVYLQAADSMANAVALTSGYFSFNGASFSHDGAYVLFSAALDSATHPDRVVTSSIYAYSLKEKELQHVVSVDGFALNGPQLSTDGRYLLTYARDLSDQGYAQTRLLLHDMSTGAITQVTDGFDRSASNATWSRDNRFVYFTAGSNGGTPLHRFELRTKRITRLTSFESGISDFDVSGTSIAMVVTEVANPFEVAVSRLDGTQLRRVSDLNHHWVSKKRLSYPEPGIVTVDGVDVQYWTMKPSFMEEGNTYPLMLNIHGGPAAMWGPGESSMWHEFQYFASRGYAVVYSNPRGSSGYGRDFQAGNFQDWGVGPAKDVLAAADIAAKLPFVDADRQVITGGSYAGYLTAWIIAHDHRFKAAMAQRGVYDLNTFLGEGNAWRLVPNHFGGYPWEAGIDSILTANSPQTFVDQIRTPLLIKHGDTDLRTGVIQSEMLYKALKIQGKPVEYIRYPRASHEMSRTGEPKQRIDRMLRMAEFFERYIQR
jgi:dipeptidyl aminopeptidase/acylaminoacyl peptidase